jgi:beta-lactamase class C
MVASRLPGMIVAVAPGDAPPQVFATGSDATGWPLAAGSLFPVASLTKLATALAVLRLADQDALTLDDPLALHLPEAVAAQSDVTLRRLLCHTAGLPPDLRPAEVPYAPGLSWPALAKACLREPLRLPPHTRVQYGNVGYGLLALVVERRTGQPFAGALDQLVLTPLGVEAYLGAELPRDAVKLAGVRGEYAGTVLEPFNSAFWCSLALPWAGLLTTAESALALLRAFNGIPAGFLSPAALAEAATNQTGDLGGGSVEPLVWPRCPWGLGPELRGAKTPHWSPVNASPASFGHAGASGCVVWYDPPTDTAFAILGTRTAENGWLLRGGAAIGAAILGAV